MVSLVTTLRSQVSKILWLNCVCVCEPFAAVVQENYFRRISRLNVKWNKMVVVEWMVRGTKWMYYYFWLWIYDDLWTTKLGMIIPKKCKQSTVTITIIINMNGYLLLGILVTGYIARLTQYQLNNMSFISINLECISLSHH